MNKKIKRQNKTHKIFIVAQIVFVVVLVGIIFVFYPRANLALEGNTVNFKSVNANVIILSANPDFSNPRYIDIEQNVSFNLRVGKYYWKASNGVIESLSKEFEIESEVGLSIIEKDDNYELQNVGNVRVNVTKKEDGSFVGHIILEPDESSEIENTGEYVGRQDG